MRWPISIRSAARGTRIQGSTGCNEGDPAPPDHRVRVRVADAVSTLMIDPAGRSGDERILPVQVPDAEDLAAFVNRDQLAVGKPPAAPVLTGGEDVRAELDLACVA